MAKMLAFSDSLRDFLTTVTSLRLYIIGVRDQVVSGRRKEQKRREKLSDVL